MIKKLNLPKIIGHRGVKDLAPENTINSILKAIKIGLKWVEVDVKITKDNIPFLLHDDDLNRTTNGKGKACLYDYSYINKLDAGNYFYKKNTNIYPPTLKEVLLLCVRNNCGINIELKPNVGLELKNVTEVLKVTGRFKKNLPILFTSFDINSSIEIIKILPDSCCGLLFDNFNYYSLNQISKLINKYNFLSCGFNIEIINKNIIKELKNHNSIFITVYSNKNISYETATYLWSIGVDSIFSDDPSNFLKNY